MENEKKNVFKKSYNSVTYRLNFLISIGAKFELENSNYTSTFITDNIRTTYITQNIGKRSFYAHSKIKSMLIKNNTDIKEIKNRPIFGNANLYFDSRDYIEPFNSERVINIDIKNAYPQTMFNEGFIDKELFDYMNTLKKKDKLASLGMLATKKVILKYHKGNIYDSDLIENKYRPIFFLLVKTIDQIMQICKQIAGDYFIFYWVDGIYFRENTPEYILSEILEFIQSLNYQVYTDLLYQFNLVKTNKLITISFFKNSKNGLEPKVFKFPDKKINENVNNFINSLYLNYGKQ